MQADLSPWNRKIIHIDMDAFYASVEQRDAPELKGKPVIVGGAPDSRGVVAAASYEARAFGVRSAMPSSRAKRICPKAVFVHPRFEVYRQVSSEIMEVFRQYTDLIEPLALDEAYLDVTKNKKGIQHATTIAKTIRKEILERTRLTASAGVAPNKFLAKIASGLNKPNGIKVVPPEHVWAFLVDLPVSKIPGVGAVTEKKMHAHELYSIGDLQRKSREDLVTLFGKTGAWFFQIAKGHDERLVNPNRIRKSIGAERTYANSLIKAVDIEEKLAEIAEELYLRLQKREIKGKCLTVKVTFDDFTKVTRSKTVNHFITSLSDMKHLASELLKTTQAGREPLRLLGLQISHLNTDPNQNFAEQIEMDFV